MSMGEFHFMGTRVREHTIKVSDFDYKYTGSLLRSMSSSRKPCFLSIPCHQEAPTKWTESFRG